MHPGPFEWAREHPSQARRALPAEGIYYIISDIHLGDGSMTDIFVAKDRHLLRFLDKVDAEGATLIVAGDAIDFSQSWSLTPILRAHGKVLGAFSRLAAKGRMTYVIGNHDFDLRLYDELLNLPVVGEVQIGDDILVRHGYEYDPVIGPDIGRSELRTRVHHGIERFFGIWLRLPLQHFYNLPNRLAFWLFHKAALLAFAKAEFVQRITGDDSGVKAAKLESEYWLLAQLGDPGGLFRPVRDAALKGDHKLLVCGHSHLPGVVRLGPERLYANTGSWTFNTATVLRIDASKPPSEESVVVQDFISGKVYGDRLYQPLIAGGLYGLTFFDWWDRVYRGWLRFDLSGGGAASQSEPR